MPSAPTGQRLDPEQAQGVFRALLDALARPGLPTRLPAGSTGLPRALVPMLALADVDVTVAVLADSRDDADAWHEVVRTATGAAKGPAGQAHMVAALRAPTPDEIAGLERGSAADPERGARLTVACRTLTAAVGGAAPGLRVEVTGPGVPGRRAFAAVGVPADVLTALEAANQGYPAGVDTWLVDDSGTAVGLPRTTRLHYEEVR
jgi:alpha-D-ribose 1-methylphosphonate 5-triphosphate synthase subunit PhnH